MSYDVKLFGSVLMVCGLMFSTQGAGLPTVSFSQIVATPIYDLQQRKIGQLRDLVLDLSEGTLISAIVSGSDGQWHGIRPSALEMRGNQHRIYLVGSFSDQDLQFNFQPGKWPDLNKEPIRSRLLPSGNVDRRSNSGLFLRASGIKGMPVTNFRNEQLGDIKDLVFASDIRRVDYLLLSTGSWAGANHRIVSIPRALFMQHTNGKKLVLNADRNRLKHAITPEDANLNSLIWGAEHQ